MHLKIKYNYFRFSGTGDQTFEWGHSHDARTAAFTAALQNGTNVFSFEPLND